MAGSTPNKADFHPGVQLYRHPKFFSETEYFSSRINHSNCVLIEEAILRVAPKRALRKNSE